ncbi:helix-turn-helix transcriptional regulator [Caldalkalibacillus mannanilyticus]|uniref:helix-turn-helix transcriptional regulator n=1 Tax=Caldalkalibacillus mannanilyticus TaxID=1418 RepID=UPI00046A0717|nr:WYL domain-containing protein [Caldalkalibacillus mannanilyticus]
MARESFDKELQFLRMMLLTTGAYNRTQFAERLGMSVHTFDKTLKKMKDLLFSLTEELQEDKRDIYRPFRYHDLDHSDHLFTFLFRAKSLKETEVTRLSSILHFLAEKECSLKELQDCLQEHEENLNQPDEKTLRQDLKYLEELTVIKRTNHSRPYMYRLDLDLLHSLNNDEIRQLYDFVDIMAHTRIPSVQGYMLRDTLKRILRKSWNEEQLQAFSYKYHYVSRILDEYHLYAICEAYQKRKSLTFIYYSPKRKIVFSAKNTNPLYEKEFSGSKQHVLPLKVIYDHQYGRWYLVAQDMNNLKLVKYRMEGITELEENVSVEESTLCTAQEQAEKWLERSWVIDTGRGVLVRLKFFDPVDTTNPFIRQRVELQGQWGMIVEEQEDGFIFEIMVNSTIEIKPWVRSFGSSCEVLEPRYFREECKKEWEVIRSYYESI